MAALATPRRDSSATGFTANFQNRDLEMRFVAPMKMDREAAFIDGTKAQKDGLPRLDTRNLAQAMHADRPFARRFNPQLHHLAASDPDRRRRIGIEKGNFRR